MSQRKRSIKLVLITTSLCLSMWQLSGLLGGDPAKPGGEQSTDLNGLLGMLNHGANRDRKSTQDVESMIDLQGTLTEAREHLRSFESPASDAHEPVVRVHRNQ